MGESAEEGKIIHVFVERVYVFCRFENGPVQRRYNFSTRLLEINRVSSDSLTPAKHRTFP